MCVRVGAPVSPCICVPVHDRMPARVCMGIN